MTNRIHGACPHDCPDTCGIVTEVENGRAVAFYGDADHPVTQGWLCAKVRPYLDHVYHPERLQTPLRRVGPKGSGTWTRISWDEALAEITGRWGGIVEAYGAEAILPYSYSGTLGLVQMGVASTRFWNRLGASQLGRTICGAAAEFAVQQTLGVRHSQPYEDVVHSKLIIIWGHNPVSTAPHFMPHLRRAQRQGATVVVIDPRRTRTARGADWHLAPHPGSDGALALGLAHILVRDDLHDEPWLAAHTIGWPALRARLAEYPPARVAGLTGLPPAAIERLAQLYGAQRPGLIKFADGLQRNRSGGQAVRALLTLPALTGQYGVAGGGIGYSTSGYLKWDGEAVGKWSACPPVGRTINMNRLGAALLGEAADPPIQSLYVFGANPAAVSPRSGRIIAGLQREDLFTVVHELFMTDTARYADIILPATSQLEQTDLHKGYGHTVLSYNAQAIAPLGECKSNWEVMALLARGMGFSEPWLQEDVDTIIDEILAATALRTTALAGIDVAALQEAGGHLPLHFEPRTPFAGSQFPTPSGKVELYIKRWEALGLDPLPGYLAPHDDGDVEDADASLEDAALNLLTPAAHHFVTSSLAAQKGLRAREGTPFVEIHPEDAAARAIESGDIVIVENGRGWTRLRAVVTDQVRPGVAAAPKGYWHDHAGGQNVNWTTSDALGDLAGQSTFHTNRVWIRRADSRTIAPAGAQTAR